MLQSSVPVSHVGVGWQTPILPSYSLLRAEPSFLFSSDVVQICLFIMVSWCTFTVNVPKAAFRSNDDILGCLKHLELCTLGEFGGMAHPGETG